MVLAEAMIEMATGGRDQSSFAHSSLKQIFKWAYAKLHKEREGRQSITAAPFRKCA